AYHSRVPSFEDVTIARLPKEVDKNLSILNQSDVVCRQRGRTRKSNRQIGIGKHNAMRNALWMRSVFGSSKEINIKRSRIELEHHFDAGVKGERLPGISKGCDGCNYFASFDSSCIHSLQPYPSPLVQARGLNTRVQSVFGLLRTVDHRFLSAFVLCNASNLGLLESIPRYLNRTCGRISTLFCSARSPKCNKIANASQHNQHQSKGSKFLIGGKLFVGYRKLPHLVSGVLLSVLTLAFCTC